MDKRIAALGWGIAVLALVAVGVQYVMFMSAQKALHDELDVNATRIKKLTHSDQEHAGEITKENNDLKRQLEELKQKLAQAETPPEAPKPEALPPNLLEGLLSSLKGSETGAAQDKKADANPMGALAKMFEGESGEKMAEYGAGMAVNMAYDDLLKGWNLPAEKEQQVRDAFKSYLSEQIKASMAAAREGGDKKTLKQIEDEGKARLRQQLATILTPEELAQWEEYEGTIDEHMLEKQYDMQLGMFAPGLSAENREIVRDTMVEEFLARKETAENMTDVAQGIDLQMDVFQQARERLAEGGQLDEAQLAELDKFITAMNAQMEMARGLFGAAQQNTQGTSQP